MEDPWADSGSSEPLGSQQSTTTTTDSTTTAPASLPSPSQSTLSPTTSSATRPSRLTPRRLVAQPTRLQAVNDDPLGPLGAAAADTAGGAGGGGTPPVPPSKEPSGTNATALPLRTTMPPAPGSAGRQPQQHRAGPAALRRVEDDDDDEEDGENDGGEGAERRGGRRPPPVQAALPSPVRSATQPSVSVEAAARPRFWIAVGDPIKVGDLTSSHIVYSVRTKVCFLGEKGGLGEAVVLTGQTTSKAYKQSEFEVKRRYRDFLWLYTTLHANNPGVVVPPPPEKQAVGRFESNFVEARRAALEKMLNKTAAHPTLQLDGDLKLFLESEAFNVDVKHKERKEPSLGESKSVLGSLGFSVGGGNKFVEQDDVSDPNS